MGSTDGEVKTNSLAIFFLLLPKHGRAIVGLPAKTRIH